MSENNNKIIVDLMGTLAEIRQYAQEAGSSFGQHSGYMHIVGLVDAARSRIKQANLIPPP